MKTQLLPVIAAAFWTLFAWQPAFAQLGGNSYSGIGVTGTGEVTAKPNVVDLKLRVAGAAELTDDAIVKHRDARDRVFKAFAALKLDNVKMDETNLKVHSAASRE